MARVQHVVNAFNTGEISPHLYGRDDLEKYNAAGQTIKNFIVHAEGGAHRRQGTRYVTEVKTSSLYTRLVPFVFSTTQAYIIEFGNAYLRFYHTEAVIESGGSPYEISSPWATADVDELQHAQSADILYVVHKDYQPRKVSRTGHAAWTVSLFDFLDGPYGLENVTATTLAIDTASVGTGRTITASSTTGINGGSGFVANDVGRLIRVGESSEWGNAKITAITDTTHVTVDVKDTFKSTGARKTWRLGSWYIGNWPSSVSFAEGRLWFGGEPNTPQSVHGSMSADFENFAPTSENVLADDTINDDNAIDYTIGANQVNVINWLEVGRNLIMGTPGGLFPLQASSNNEPVTPTNVNVPQSTAFGTRAIQPRKTSSRTVYVSRAAIRVRALKYSFEVDDFISEDLTKLADHITTSGIIHLEYQQEPESIVWALRSDGKLAALTYVPEEEVFAWHLHQIGGSFGSGDAVVESIAVIPSPNADHDQLWMVVKRTVNGSTVRYVEFMEEGFHDADLEDAFFVDSGLTYDDAAATTITGLTMLVAETVSILADGAPVADQVVSAAGTITLGTAASKVHVGLSYNSDLIPVKPPLSLPGGSSQSQLRRPSAVVTRFHDTAGGKVGRDLDNLDEMQFREQGDVMDSPPGLFTGDKRQTLEGGYDRDGLIAYRQDQPLPMSVLSLTWLGEGADR